MKHQNQISISELQFNLSRTLNQVTDTQMPVHVTNRGQVTHQIIPVQKTACQCENCTCASPTAAKAGGFSYESQC